MWWVQVYSDSEDGERFMRFYPVTAWPYVAVLDPRTRTQLSLLHRLDALFVSYTYCTGAGNCTGAFKSAPKVQ